MILGDEDDYYEDQLYSPPSSSYKLTEPASHQSSEAKPNHFPEETDQPHPRCRENSEEFTVVPGDCSLSDPQQDELGGETAPQEQAAASRGAFTLHPLFVLEWCEKSGELLVQEKPAAALLGGTDTIKITELSKLRSPFGGQPASYPQKFTVFSVLGQMKEQAQRSYGQLQRLQKNLLADLPFAVLPHLPALKGEPEADLTRIELFLRKLAANPSVKQTMRDSSSFAFTDFLNSSVAIVGSSEARKSGPWPRSSSPA